ncbi:MAG: PDZ domain-containing protein [Saprospiraceae bacterium]
MKKVVDKIIEKGGNLDVKPSLGISAATIDKDAKEAYDLDVDKGLYVVEVESGSSAESGGILPGDIITQVDDTNIEKFEDLFKVLNLANIGDVLNIKVIRNNKSKNIVVKLKQSL